eukprot:3936417-Rhodomonas_salina.2
MINDHWLLTAELKERSATLKLPSGSDASILASLDERMDSEPLSNSDSQSIFNSRVRCRLFSLRACQVETEGAWSPGIARVVSPFPTERSGSAHCHCVAV